MSDLGPCHHLSTSVSPAPLPAPLHGPPFRPMAPCASPRPPPLRWATAQRRAMQSGLLSEDKLELLQELGFEADEDEAEWLRWFMDLAR